MANSKDTRENQNSDTSREKIIYDICKQIEEYLPLRSRDELIKKMGSVTVGSQKIPLELLAPHIGENIFPVKSADSVKEYVSEGVHRALSLGRSASRGKKSIRFSQAMSELSSIGSKAQLRRPAILDIYYPDSDA